MGEGDPGWRWQREQPVDTSGDTCRRRGHLWFRAPRATDPLDILAQCRTCSARRDRPPGDLLPPWESER